MNGPLVDVFLVDVRGAGALREGRMNHPFGYFVPWVGGKGGGGRGGGFLVTGE